jgi:hypothetical protein
MTTDVIIRPTNYQELSDFARLAANSELVPRDYRGKVGNVMIACQMGSELGLSPMQSLNSIAVINGRPGVWGDGLIGLCRQSPLCEDIVETLTGEGDDREAVCIAKRRGAAPVEGRFSVADAKRARLWGKPGPWTEYPDRMLRNRARSFALRDAFPDVLRGLRPVEELLDTPRDRKSVDDHDGPTIEADATPFPDQASHSEKSPPAPAPPENTTPLQAAKQNYETPKQPQTIAQFLDNLDQELERAPDSDAIAALLNGPRLEQAKKRLSGEARQRLAHWIGRAEGRLEALRKEEQAQAAADDAAEAAIETPAPPTDGMPPDIDDWPMVGEDKLAAG